RDFHVTGVQTCALPILGEPAVLDDVDGLGAQRSARTGRREARRVEEPDPGLVLLGGPRDERGAAGVPDEVRTGGEETGAVALAGDRKSGVEGRGGGLGG